MYIYIYTFVYVINVCFQIKVINSQQPIRQITLQIKCNTNIKSTKLYTFATNKL